MTNSQLASNPMFARVIRAMQSKYDANAIVQDMITKYPEVFVELVENATTLSQFPAEFQLMCRRLFDELRNGNNVSAIKYLREYTGYGLKEAKDIVDNIVQMMFKQSHPATVIHTPELVVFLDNVLKVLRSREFADHE